MLNEATSADDAPTPGYLLADISKQTLANYTACVQLQEFLASRVKKDNHNVKFKCLVIVKHVCRTGRPEFKKEIGRNIEAIKECLQYRGPPDPLRGDEIYKRVRDAAKEAIDAIYDSQMPTTTSSVAASNRIQGMGGGYVEDTTTKLKSNSSIFNSVSTALGNFSSDTDASYTGHAGATSSFVGGNSNNNESYRDNASYSKSSGPAYGTSTMSSSGMVGLGNPNFKDPRGEKTFLERAQESAATMVSSISSKMNSLNMDSGSSKKFDSPDAGFGYVTNRGTNAYGPTNQYSTGYGSQQPSSSWSSTGANNITTGTNNNEPIGIGKAGNAASDGEYERGLIEALCEPAGLKPVPPEDKLQAFLVSVVTLSPDTVGNCLLDVLNSESWQSRSKALQVIQSVGKSRGCNKFVDWFTSNAADDLLALLNDSKSSVRQQAEKTLKILKIEFTANGSEAVGRNKVVDTQVNLLDTDQVDMPSSIPPPVPVASSEDIFSGMQQNVISNTNSVSTNYNQPAMSSAPTTTESNNNATSSAFDFLNDPISSAATTVATPVSTLISPVVNDIAPPGNTSSSIFEGLAAPSNNNIRPIMMTMSSGMPIASIGMPMNYTNNMSNMNMNMNMSAPMNRNINTSVNNTSQFSFINNPSTTSSNSSSNSGSNSSKGIGSDSFSFVQDVIKSSKK